MRWSLAVMVVIVTLATLLYGCGKTSSPVEKQAERECTGQAETTASEPTDPTCSSGSAAGGVSARSKRRSPRRT